MLESKYQAYLIKRLRSMFPDCIVIKNDPNYIQGIPDLLVLIGGFWAALEVKASWDSKEQPNQDYYVRVLNEMSFAAFIHPDNEEEVIDALEQALAASWDARVP